MDDLKDIIEEVKIRNDIADVISDYIQLKDAGSNFKGLCPFHNEKTPSFNVNTSKQIYKCFGCGEGGDVISFIMKMENLDFIEAVRFLADRIGISINTNINEKTKAKFEKMKKFQEINIEAARFFYSCLINSENDGYKYLLKRGLDIKTIKKFGLGYSPDSWDMLKNFLIKKGYTQEELFECGLLSMSKNNNYYDKYRNRVIFPIFDYKGNVIGFGGRVLDDSLPKYLNSPDSELFNKRYNLYGLNLARKNLGTDKKIILVEGYMDMISMYQYGIKNIVATLGTALTSEQALLIKKFADEVVLSYDSDEAGIKATLRAIEIIEKNGIKATILDLKEYKDPDEFIRAKGLSYVLNSIENSTSSMKFKIDILLKDFDLSKKEDRVDFLKDAVKLIASIKSPIELDFYVGYLSNLTNTNKEIITSEIFSEDNSSRNTRYRSNTSNFKRNYGANRYSSRKNIGMRKKFDNFNTNIKSTDKKLKNVVDGGRFIEMNVIKAMLESENARLKIPLLISKDDFSEDDSKKIYDKVLNLNKKGNITIDEIYNEDINHEYLAKLGGIHIDLKIYDDYSEIEKLVNQFLNYRTQIEVNKLLKKQKTLEDRRKTMEDKSEEAREVDLEIMKIALEIVAENKKIKS